MKTQQEKKHNKSSDIKVESRIILFVCFVLVYALFFTFSDYMLAIMSLRVDWVKGCMNGENPLHKHTTGIFMRIPNMHT